MECGGGGETRGGSSPPISFREPQSGPPTEILRQRPDLRIPGRCRGEIGGPERGKPPQEARWSPADGNGGETRGGSSHPFGTRKFNPGIYKWSARIFSPTGTSSPDVRILREKVVPLLASRELRALAEGERMDCCQFPTPYRIRMR
jgi:hypothetical protein